MELYDLTLIECISARTPGQSIAHVWRLGRIKIVNHLRALRLDYVRFSRMFSGLPFEPLSLSPNNLARLFLPIAPYYPNVLLAQPEATTLQGLFKSMSDSR